MSKVHRRGFLHLGASAAVGAAIPNLASGAAQPAPVPQDSVRTTNCSQGPERVADVAVVGAGLAGLTAAHELHKLGYVVHVVEADRRVGGRTWTTYTRDGSALDFGAHFVGPTQTRILALADELGVQRYPTFNTGQNVQLFAGVRGVYEGTTPLLDLASLLEVQQAIADLETMAASIDVDAPWEAPEAEAWDSQTVWSWSRQTLVTDGARKLIDLSILSLLSVESRELSLLYLLFYIRSAGSLSSLLDVEGGAQESQFVGGTQQIARRLAERLGANALTLDSPVRSIETSDDRTRVVADRVTVSARRVVIAIPPPLIPRIAFNPPLSALKDQLYQRLPMGSVGKAIAVYDKPFWREAGLSGQATSDEGPVKVIFDNSPESGCPGILMGFIDGQDARAFGAQSPEERQNAVLRQFGQLFGARAREPQEYHEVHWDALPLHRGCPVAVPVPGALLGFGPQLRASEGPLHFASTETATRWAGYMDGAIQAGQRAAQEVAHNL